MKPTLEELQVIDNDRTHEQRRVRLAVNNNICPNCGSKLERVSPYRDVYDKPIKFLGITLSSYDLYESATVCSKDIKCFVTHLVDMDY